MKKILPILLIISLMLASAVSAFVMPLPVYGQVTINGIPHEGFNVEVRNLRTGDSVVTETNSNGEFQVELANLPNQYYPGDDIFVRACSGDSMCERTVKAQGGRIQLDFDITDMNVIVFLKGVAVGAGDVIIAIGYWWFAGFFGMVSYWYAKKTTRGKKMLTTFFKKLKLGKYKK